MTSFYRFLLLRIEGDNGAPEIQNHPNRWFLICDTVHPEGSVRAMIHKNC